MPLLLERIDRGEIDPSFVITHRLRLDDAPRAYEVFRDKRDDCIIERSDLDDPGVIDEDVDGGPPFQDCVDGGAHVGPPAYVAPDRQES